MQIQEPQHDIVALKSSDYSSIMRAAIEFSLDFGQIQYPLSMENISALLNIRVVRYQDLSADVIAKVADSDAVTIPRHLQPISDDYVIFFNDSPQIPVSRIRFSLAHELAHLYLPEYRNSPANERACDFFAANLLAPTCLILREHYQTVDQVMEAFYVSRSCAEHSLHRAQQHVGKPLLDCEIELMKEAIVLRKV